MATAEEVASRYVHGATSLEGRQKNFNAVEAAVWIALEPHLEDHIHLDLNESDDTVLFGIMVAEVARRVMETVTPDHEQIEYAYGVRYEDLGELKVQALEEAVARSLVEAHPSWYTLVRRPKSDWKEAQ